MTKTPEIIEAGPEGDFRTAAEMAALQHSNRASRRAEKAAQRQAKNPQTAVSGPHAVAPEPRLSNGQTLNQAFELLGKVEYDLVSLNEQRNFLRSEIAKVLATRTGPPAAPAPAPAPPPAPAPAAAPAAAPVDA